MQLMKACVLGMNLHVKYLNKLKLDVEVTPVDSNAFPAKAKRPNNSRMSKEMLDKNGFDRLPTWQDALRRYLKEIEK